MPTFYSNCSTITANSGCKLYYNSNLTGGVGQSFLSDGTNCYETDILSEVIAISQCSGGGSPVPPLNTFQVYMENTPGCSGVQFEVFTSNNATGLATAVAGETLYKYPQGFALIGYSYVVEITGGDIYNLNSGNAVLGVSTGVAC